MHKPRRGLRMRAVKEKTGLRETQIFDAIKRGIFPLPYKILPGGRAIAWDEAELDEFLEARMSERARQE